MITDAKTFNFHNFKIIPNIDVNENIFEVDGLDEAPFNLAHDLANRVTGLGNKDASVLIVGDKGLGKSSAALGLAQGCNNEVSAITGRTLEDVFNWKRDIAVIDPVNTVNTLNAARPKSCVVLLDDMSVSIDSRKHQSKENIESSHVWITMRTLRQIVIGTTISGSLIDKRARENFTYVIIMKDDKRYDNIFENGYGIRIGDLRGVKKDSLYDEIKYPRLKLHENYNHVVYSNILCFPPSHDLLTYYDGFRESEAQRLRDKGLQSDIEVEVVKDDKPKCPKCKSIKLYYSKRKNKTHCNGCGYNFD